jgi:signal transduction histidine kinase
MSAVLSTSLFKEVQYVVGDATPAMLCTKATLVQLLHTLEDVILTHHIPALMFTGFQESIHWHEEIHRYQALAGITQQMCIFAGQPHAENLPAKMAQIELVADDPLRQEWFVVILSAAFSVILCSKDKSALVKEEGLRQFETILSFSPHVINRVLDRLETILMQYRPDLLPIFQANRQRYPVPTSNLDLVTLVISQMVQYQETLTQRIRTTEANKRVEERLRFELEKERELGDIRHILLTTISHEFRTPLTIIQSSTELMARHFDTLTPDNRQKRLLTIKTQIEQLRLLLDDVDTILAAHRDSLLFQPTTFNPVDFCQELVATFQQQVLKTHRILFQSHWTQAGVQADERLLRLILTNLLSNAAKFSPHHLDIELELSEMPGQMIFYVRDQGIGIPKHNQGRIFEAFYRGSNVGSIGGTGLGLKIVYDCIQLHNGSIHFTTNPTGTTFVVRLPIIPKHHLKHRL